VLADRGYDHDKHRRASNFARMTRQMDSPRAELEPRWKRTESGFDDWVAMATERAEPFMAWLGVLFALLVGYDIATDPAGSTSEVLSIASWAIWAIFVF
jgi:hypothetical protein